MTRSKRIVLTVVLFVMTVLGVMAAVWGLRASHTFDPAVWQEPESENNYAKHKMADRIVANRSLYGKTRAEVIAMLGEARETEYFSEYDMVYLLGPERGFISIDSEWLVIRLDSEGRVSETRIARD